MSLQLQEGITKAKESITLISNPTTFDEGLTKAEDAINTLKLARGMSVNISSVTLPIKSPKYYGSFNKTVLPKSTSTSEFATTPEPNEPTLENIVRTAKSKEEKKQQGGHRTHRHRNQKKASKRRSSRKA
jgi:hypothetical protein